MIKKKSVTINYKVDAWLFHFNGSAWKYARTYVLRLGLFKENVAKVRWAVQCTVVTKTVINWGIHRNIEIGDNNFSREPAACIGSGKGFGIMQNPRSHIEIKSFHVIWSLTLYAHLALELLGRIDGRRSYAS